MIPSIPSDTINKTAKQIRVIEPEMQPHSGLYPMPPTLSSRTSELLEPVLTQAFVSQSLLGNIIFSSVQRERIHALAEVALSSALHKNHIDNFCCDIIVLETVLLLRNWTDSDDEDNTDAQNLSFWEYICKQYAVDYDDNFGNSYSYRVFKHVIKKSLKRHKRLFVNSGKQYYTTMLTHSLAPKTKFFDLYEQIFAFYAKSLHYQYNKADPAFQAFADTMKHGFESKSLQSNDAIYIKSVQHSSAIKALFTHCPQYMGGFVEQIVCAIDTLIAKDTIENHSYINTLLLDWYHKRSREERSFVKRERSKSGKERVITEFASIRTTYCSENGQIFLSIPAIRLGAESDTLPWLTIYRDSKDTSPYSKQLRYYGDYFCITSTRTIVPVDELLTDSSRCLELRVVVTHAGKDIYDSGTRLYRDFIAFDNDGSEISNRPNNQYVNIFVAAKSEVEGTDTAVDCVASPSGKGIVYRVLFGDNTCIAVNGIDLFPVEQVISGITLNISTAPAGYCKYLFDQQKYSIFTKQTTLVISSEDPSLDKKYRLVVNEMIFALVDYYDDSSCSYRFPLPAGEETYELRIIENTTQQRLYTLRYVLFENFALTFDGFYYSDDFCQNGSLEIKDNESCTSYPYKILSGQESMFVPYGEGDLSIDIPLMRCILDGNHLTPDLVPTIWYNDIPMSALLELYTPRGYHCTVIIGQKSFMKTKIDIGNEIRTRHDSDIETVGVFVRKAGPPIQIKLFDIAFKPSFEMPPLQVEDGALLWCVEDNFIGDQKSEFEIHISYKGRNTGCYKASREDKIIPLERPLENGVYDATVLVKSPGFFAPFEKLWQGQFIVGAPAQFRFDDCAVIVTEAIFENERIKLNETSGIITDLQYIGEKSLNGETQYYPCYEGCLQYKHNGRLQLYATVAYERNGTYREQVNPVKLWVINEYVISLRAPTNDGLYVNTKWSSITDRTPPNRNVLRVSQENYYCIPDYYSIRVIKQSEVDHV